MIPHHTIRTGRPASKHYTPQEPPSKDDVSPQINNGKDNKLRRIPLPTGCPNNPTWEPRAHPQQNKKTPRIFHHDYLNSTNRFK